MKSKEELFSVETTTANRWELVLAKLFGRKYNIKDEKEWGNDILFF